MARQLANEFGLAVKVYALEVVIVINKVLQRLVYYPNICALIYWSILWR